MIKFLNDIRNAENPISNHRKIINTIAILFLGIVLGTFIVLRRDTLRNSALMETISIVLAALFNIVIPFHFG